MLENPEFTVYGSDRNIQRQTRIHIKLQQEVTQVFLLIFVPEANAVFYEQELCIFQLHTTGTKEVH